MVLQVLKFRLGCSLYPTCGQDLCAALAVCRRMPEQQQGQRFSEDATHCKAILVTQNSPASLQVQREVCRAASVRNNLAKGAGITALFVE